MNIKQLNEELERILEEDNIENVVDYILDFIFNKNRFGESIEVQEHDIPEFKSKKDISKWFQKIFEDIGKVTVEDGKAEIHLYPVDADREAFKRRMLKPENRAVAIVFKQLLESSHREPDREADDGHRWNQQVYTNELKIIDSENNSTIYKVTIFIDVVLQPENRNRYAGHKTEKK